MGSQENAYAHDERPVALIRLIYAEARRRHDKRKSAQERPTTPSELLRGVMKDVMAATKLCLMVRAGVNHMDATKAALARTETKEVSHVPKLQEKLKKHWAPVCCM